MFQAGGSIFKGTISYNAVSKLKLTWGGIDGVNAGDPAVRSHRFGCLAVASQTLDCVSHEVGCGDKGGGRQTEDGGQAVVEDEDPAVDGGAGVVHLGHPH